MMGFWLPLPLYRALPWIWMAAGAGCAAGLEAPWSLWPAGAFWGAGFLALALRRLNRSGS